MCTPTSQEGAFVKIMRERVEEMEQKPWPYPNDPEPRPAIREKLVAKPWLRASPKPFDLVNCTIVDAAAGKLLPGTHTIRISNGEIESITPSGQSADSSAETFDVKGKFICPGLIDCHVHCSAIPGTTTISDMVRTPPTLVSLRSTYVLQGMLERGFTTVRDTGGASKHLANCLAEGLIPGPRLFQCGKALSQTGGHGDFLPGESGGDGGGVGCCGGHVGILARTVDGVPEATKAAREELKQGADFLKIMTGGGVASETDSIESVQFLAEEIQAITATAWQMGKKMVTAHAYTVEAIEHAVKNGVKGIEHGNLLDRKTAKMYALHLSGLMSRMAEKGVYLTPTLSCYGIMARPPFLDFLPPSGLIKNEQVMSKGLEALKIAHEEGVTICYGSDLLIASHACQTEEFTVRSKILQSDVILRHATTNAAKLLGMTGKLGTVSEGAFADLLVLDKNPLEDIKLLDRPEDNLRAVIQGGRVVSGSL